MSRPALFRGSPPCARCRVGGTLLILLLAGGCCQRDARHDAAKQSGQSLVPAGTPASVGEDAPAEGLELLVLLEAGTDPAQVAERHGLEWLRTLQSDSDAHVFRAATREQAREVILQLEEDVQVRAVYFNTSTQHQPRDP